MEGGVVHRACLFLLLCLSSIVGGLLDASPPYNGTFRDSVAAYRTALPTVTSIPVKCGIMWTLATAAGIERGNPAHSLSDSVGFHRVLSVAYEVLQSASRVKHAVQLNGTLPSHCNGQLELLLVADRHLLESIKADLGSDYSGVVGCIFDRVQYFQDLPLHLLPFSTVGDGSEATKRLSSRSNLLKMVALLSTPYQYTLYLDGDTAPCPTFPFDPFVRLTSTDLITTQNPFGFQSTGGNPLYPGAPKDGAYRGFAEPNGGVLGYQWNSRTMRFWVRVLELVPFFTAMGYDQDQAFMRHALFEESRLHQLRVDIQPMSRYCRFGWNCERNRCATGCVIIHQRICVSNGINHNFTISQTDHDRCGRIGKGEYGDLAWALSRRYAFHSRGYRTAWQGLKAQHTNATASTGSSASGRKRDKAPH